MTQYMSFIYQHDVQVKSGGPYFRGSAVLILWDICLQDMENLYECVCLCNSQASVWNLWIFVKKVWKASFILFSNSSTISIQNHEKNFSHMSQLHSFGKVIFSWTAVFQNKLD